MKYLFILFFTFSSLWASIQSFSGSGQEVLIDQVGTIRVLTWNILGLPNHQVAIRPWEDRIDGIAQKISSINADVVILQECFEKDLSLGLYERLKKQYSHVYLHLDAKPTPLPSGLALFSKLPLADVRFTPHPDLMDGERNSKMGTIDFVLLSKNKKPIGHIAASHFQGSSNCEWRVGLTEDGARMSYAEVREQEATAAMNLSSPDGVPRYLCGDLNVDRRSIEFYTSVLNSQINPKLLDCMKAEMKMRGTNTNFWKHEKGIEKMYPSLSKKQALDLAIKYKKIYNEKLFLLLAKNPWQEMLFNFNPSYFSTVEKAFDLSQKDDQMIWEYFKAASISAVNGEMNLWKTNKNVGEGPNVSIGQVLQIRALPIEEALDCVLGINQLSMIEAIEILEGYEDSSFEKTLSDHHPVVATIYVAEG